jgi:hypothetical protein
MIRRRPLALALTLLLGACDDGTVISHVDRLSHMKAGDLATMQENGALRVEIHGIPWKGATDTELASALRPPAGEAQDIRFQAVPAGQWVNGRGHRLVLHFNPTGAPNSQRDCETTAEIRTGAPSGTGFTVNATVCTKDGWLAHGYLQAPKTAAGDWEEYTRVMQLLLTSIFAEATDR